MGWLQMTLYMYIIVSYDSFFVKTVLTFPVNTVQSEFETAILLLY